MHCHLDLYKDPFSVVKKCISEKVYVLSVTTTPKAWIGTSSFESPDGKIRTALGLHPQLAHLRLNELELFDSLLDKTKYVGEIGLDGSNEYKPYLEKQLVVFRHILKSIQKSGGKIMSIHSRASATLILDELEKHPGLGIPIFHWFSGNSSELKRAIELGCWFSVGPSMIHTKKGALIVSQIPKNCILTETDGPFGKFRNKILMPWDAVQVIPELATIWSIDTNEVNAIISNNFRELISK